MRSNNKWSLMGTLYRAHPWHGIALGSKAPELVPTFIEIVPTDTVKYELDKQSGILKVDRPQRFSNVCPALYGMIPQTYCNTRVAEFCMQQSGYDNIVGDQDPLDVCVLTEKDISHGNILVDAIPIGGLRMIDGDEADDKIIAVMKDDVTYGTYTDITSCAKPLIERLRHYFLTYKQAPDSDKTICEITHVFGREEALEIIRRSQQDYLDKFGHLQEFVSNELGFNT